MTTAPSYPEAPQSKVMSLGDMEMRHEALKRILYPRELGVCPITDMKGSAIEFVDMPESWSVYKAQVLETYFLLQNSSKIAEIPVTYEHEGVRFSVPLDRAHVLNQLADTIRRQFV